MDLLHAIAAERPELLLTGSTLRDQGLMITGLRAVGWPSSLLRELVMRPLPDPLHKSVGAVISHRLRTAAAMPVPTFTARDAVPQQRPAPDLEHQPEQHDRAAPTPPGRELLAQQHDRLRRGVHGAPECAGDDGLCDRLAVVGEPMCARHLGWPLCPGSAGQACPVRTRDGEQCAGCRERDYHVHVIDRLLVPESDDGTCPGYNTPCGRPVVSTGLCLRCRLVSQEDRDRIEQEWQQGLAEAVAAASAEEPSQVGRAPF
ncbi:hypothetical protein [Streptomyces microflavus]|uniref:hypothetical protein n=1 Tax=Streptomyces microflavus TaxID=1919 RepID=UPI003635BBB5